jgi:hypothetical protein
MVYHYSQAINFTIPFFQKNQKIKRKTRTAFIRESLVKIFL